MMLEAADFRLLLLLLLLSGPAAQAEESIAGPLKSARLGLVVSRLTVSELRRRPPEDRKQLLRAIRGGLESCFAKVIPLTNVGRARGKKLDILAILRIRLPGDRVDVELEFWTPGASRVAAVKAVGRGPGAGEDAAADIVDALLSEVGRLRQSIEFTSAGP